MDGRNDRVALVTGAGRRRVGNTVATMLAEAGFRVGLHYHRSEEQARETAKRIDPSGQAARIFQADVTEEAQVDRMFDRVIESFGRLDVLVTAAAVWESKSLEEVSAEDVRRQFDINALGTFLCARRGGLIMTEQPEGGAIVMIGDWAVVRPYRDYAAYFPSKGAIPTITRNLAIELAHRNPRVRVNSILPGPVLLPEEMPAEQRRRIIEKTLVRREGRPEHVGQAVLFLVENDYVTGVCLPVDGGRTIAP